MATVLTLRRTQTSPLSNDQIDDNFLYIQQTALDANGLAQEAKNTADAALTMATAASTLSTSNKLSIDDIYSKLNSNTGGSGGGTGTLGYNAVRQGGGSNQTDIQINIGVSQSVSAPRLLVQTGGTSGTNYADKWPIDIDGTASKVPWTGVTGVNSSMNAYGNRFVSTQAPTATNGIDGDIWYQV